MLTEYSKSYVPKYMYPVELVREHEEAHWTEAEVKLQTDVEQWKTGVISDKDKEYIKSILRMFTQSDVNVGHDYYDILIPRIKNNEVRNMLGSFAGREGVHQRAYAQLTDTLGFGDSFHEEFTKQAATSNIDVYMTSAANHPKSQAEFGVYIAKQMMMEGVLLFAQFAGLMQYDLKGMLPGMSDTVRWSVRDESLHIKGLAWLFRQWCAEHPRIVNDEFKRAIYDNAREANYLANDFAQSLGDGISVTSKQLYEYAQYITDYRLAQIGFKPVGTVDKDPIPEVTALFDAATMGNFFEREITEYSRNNLSGEFSAEVYSKWA